MEDYQSALDQWRKKFSEAEEVMKAMEGDRELLEEEKDDISNQFEALKLMVEPYRSGHTGVDDFRRLMKSPY